MSKIINEAEAQVLDILSDVELLLEKIRTIKDPAHVYKKKIEKFIFEFTGLTFVEFSQSTKYVHKDLRALIFIALYEHVDINTATDFLSISRYTRVRYQYKARSLLLTNKRIGKSTAVKISKELNELLK